MSAEHGRVTELQRGVNVRPARLSVTSSGTEETPGVDRSDTLGVPVPFDTILQVALDSAHLRVLESISGLASVKVARHDEPVARLLSQSIHQAMRALGRLYRDSGHDLRDHRLWLVLELQDEYERQFEYNRRINLSAGDITPRLIYECLDNRNVVACSGWTIEAGISREFDDDFGQPTRGRSIELRDPRGELHEWKQISKSNARAVYRVLIGHPFDGTDDLGFDAPHPAENIPSWMVNPDGSVCTGHDDNY